MAVHQGQDERAHAVLQATGVRGITRRATDDLVRDLGLREISRGTVPYLGRGLGGFEHAI